MKMKFKSLFLPIILLLTLKSCAQENQMKNLKLNESINKKNIVEEIYKERVNATENPIYYFVITKNLCFLEIFVNDIPLVYDNKEVSIKNGQPVNKLIQNVGIQNVTLKMSPYGKTVDNNYDTLLSESSVKIKVVKINSNNPSEEEVIKIFETSNNQNEGKKNHEESFTFNANVPFSFKELANAQDLKHLSSQIMNEKIIKTFNTMRDLLASSDPDNIAKLSFPIFKRQFVSEYYSKEKMNQIVKGTFNQFNNKIDMKSIENYQIVYYANGKMVSLVQNNENPLFKHKPSLWGNVKIDNIDRPIFFPIYLYLPKGKTEFEIY